MRILLVEDSERLRSSVSAALKRSGYAVDTAADGDEALSFAGSYPYDVVVLDIMLPKRDGLSVVAELRRRHSAVHVLMLTARDTIEDRVRGLKAGADDYLVKPFALEELLARIQALCRRAYIVKSPHVVVGDLEIDTAARTVSRGGRSIDLKPREFALLELLALRRGEVVSRRDIEAHLYDATEDPASNVIESAISQLRKRLSQSGAQTLIHTRHGHGYMLEEKMA